MEIAIPALALGTLYIISKQEQCKNQEIKKEAFTQNKMGGVWKSSTWPEDTKKDLIHNVNSYLNPNQRSDKYFTKETANNWYKKNCNDDTNGEVSETFTSLTGETINSKDFEHNNQVPFFGSSVKQSVGNYDRAEARLDNMTGSGSQQIKKGESAPLFKPKPDIGWGSGVPNHTGFMQSRQNIPNRMGNTKMFESIMVGPGLNKKDSKGKKIYEAKPDHTAGLNQAMDNRDVWGAKPVVTQRMTTSRTQFLGAKGFITNRGKEGKVVKNRPDTFYINGPEHYFTTTGVEKAQTARSTQVLPPENRPTTTREYFGGGFHDTDAPASRGRYRQSTKPVGKALQHTPAYAPGNIQTDNSLGVEGYKNRPNERTLTEENNFWGGAGSIVSALMSPITDTLRPSRKENVIGNARQMGNARGPDQYPVHNPADRPRTTMKETTTVNNYAPNMNRSLMQNGGGYSTNSHQPIYNHRMSTNCGGFGNPGGTSMSSNAPLYDGAYNMELNQNKEKLIKGRKPSGNMKLSHNGYKSMCVRKNECDRVNQRVMAPQMISETSGTKQTIGKMLRKKSLKQDVICERNQTQILKAFRDNPYTKSLHSIA